jgi:hypothetical protein
MGLYDLFVRIGGKWVRCNLGSSGYRKSKRLVIVADVLGLFLVILGAHF